MEVTTKGIRVQICSKWNRDTTDCDIPSQGLVSEPSEVRLVQTSLGHRTSILFSSSSSYFGKSTPRRQCQKYCSIIKSSQSSSWLKQYSPQHCLFLTKLVFTTLSETKSGFLNKFTKAAQVGPVQHKSSHIIRVRQNILFLWKNNTHTLYTNM